MVKATIKERYIYSTSQQKRQGIHEREVETRYFTNMDKFHEWYDTFKTKLWEDDRTKVDLAEGVYVVTEEIPMDDTSEPKKLGNYATFRKDVSYHYAA